MCNIYIIHGTDIKQNVTQNRCARKEQSLSFDLFKAFDQIVSSHKSDYFGSTAAYFQVITITVLFGKFAVPVLR